MELQVFEKLEHTAYLRQLYNLLEAADQEFIPPLSCRGSTTQQTLSDASSNGIADYFAEMKQQCFVLALEGQQVAGFMSFKKDYHCDYVPAGRNLYASTSVVSPDFRGQGLMKKFYLTMIEHYPDRAIYTRTWHENFPHLRVLDQLGFVQIAELPNHRGPGIHTVYFRRNPNGIR